MMSIASRSATSGSSTAVSTTFTLPTRRASLISGSYISSNLHSPPLVMPSLRYSLTPDAAADGPSDGEACKLLASASPAQLAYFEQLTNMFEDEADAKLAFPGVSDFKEPDAGRLAGNKNCCTIC